MKKSKMLGLIGLSLAVLMVGACANNNNNDNKSNSGSQQVVTRYTVAFEVDGARYQTLKVKAGEKITDTVADPVKEGFNFVGWYLGEEKVDFSTYVVTGDVTFVAKFEEAGIDTSLNVNDKKEEGKEYYLVVGWWECTKIEDGVQKYTSYLTENAVRVFYANIINYLKIGHNATDEQIAAISFRNYSSEDVASMGELINADKDVDLMIGVGNNINSKANVTLYDGNNNDYKFETAMGPTQTKRYVACTSYASELGVATFNWLKNTNAGAKSLLSALTEQEIRDSFKIDLSVTVHGDTVITTTLDDAEDVIEMPVITIPEGKLFKGFATSEDGEVVLDVAKDATLKYADVKGLVAEGANTLDLYPVFAEKPVVLDDLVAYVQVNSGLKEVEAKLLQARFQAANPDKNIKFNIVEGNATTFKDAIGDDADVVIGGNNPVNNLSKHADGPTANAGAKHFADGSRKVIISAGVAESHLDLAKALYNFVVADATVFEVHTSFWLGKATSDTAGSNVTTDEIAAIKAGAQTQLETVMGVEAGKLEETYNVVLSYYETTKTKVADMGAETRALRDGKGTDLIVGCGGNVDEEGKGDMTIVEKKTLGAPFVAATGRYVALVNDNVLTRALYDTYFVTAVTE